MKPTNNSKDILIFLTLFIALATLVNALPTGPSPTYITTMESPVATTTLVDNSSHTGGTINIMNLNARQQNLHWKAYAGNVSGSLVLEDADSYSIFEWSLGAVTGEVYATRASSINWSSVTCATNAEVQAEMTAMNHTTAYTPDDAINETFNVPNNHDGFLAGPSNIVVNTCTFTLETFVNDTAQSGTEYFEEILLHDETSIIYATIMESAADSYRTGKDYDYQILVAEKGEPTWQGQVTSYYFYVELL